MEEARVPGPARPGRGDEPVTVLLEERCHRRILFRMGTSTRDFDWLPLRC
jgi:hypothetical protein